MHTSISKKLLAGLLSVVMVLSLFAAVPASNAQAASVSVSGYSKIASGYTYSYKIQNLSSTQYAKVSVSGEATTGTALGETGKSSVKLTRIDGSTVKSTTKINGCKTAGLSPVIRVKASYAWGKTFTITVKVYNRSNNKLVKTVEKTIRVHRKTKDIQLSRDVVSLKVGEDVTVTAETVPAEYTLPITWSVADPSVASVVKGVITAKAAGTTTVTAKSGSFTKTIDVVVTEEVAEENAEVAKVELKVANALKDMEYTLLVTQDAQVVATAYDKDGNVVPNAQIYLSLKNDPRNATHGAIEVVGNGLSVTNENGEATFLVTHEDSGATIADTDYVGAASYTATVVGNTAVKADGAVYFAAIDYGSVKVVNGTTDPYLATLYPTAGTVPGLVKGTNAADALAQTSSVNKTAVNVDYVSSQQVNKQGTTNHQVVLSSSVGLIAPAALGSIDQQTKEFEQIVDVKSGAYGTMDDEYTIIPIDVDTTKLDYATLHINNIQLSKYTKLVISSYASEYDATYDISPIATTVIRGEKEQSSFGYQIPVSNAVTCIRVDVVSAGQVNTAKNGGFEISKITGMYKKTVSTSFREVADAVEVTWEKAESILYSEDKNLVTDGYTAVLGSAYNAAHKYLYQVPTFPQVGNAIIREYDANGKLLAYYACPTINKVVGTVAQNENIIKAGATAFLVTEDEAKNLTGTVEQYGNYALVNAELVGTTPIVGKVSIENVSDEDVSVENAKVYTSVQWSPIPTTGTTPSTPGVASTPFVALKGQTVEIEAQIVDDNGNKVSQSGIDLTFKYGAHDNSHTATAIAANATLDTVNDAVKVTSAVTRTDYNGVAKITVQSASVDTLENLVATTTASYNVVLRIGGVEVSQADVYWLDADLSFTPDVADTGLGRGTTYGSEASVPTVEPFAGETWEYEFAAQGSTTLSCGVLAGCTATLEGVNLNFKTSGMTDTVSMEKVNGSAVTLTAKKAGLTYLKASVDQNSLGSNVTASVYDPTYRTTTVATFVGTGSTNIDKSITLPINWKTTGLSASWVTPHNTNAEAGVNRDLFLKVVDANGYPVSGQNVVFSVGAVTASAITTSDGVAKYTVSGSSITAGTNVIVTATVDGMEGQTFSTTINGKVAGTDIATACTKLALVQAVYEAGAPDTVILTFNKDVDEKSINAKQFKVKKADGTATYAVKSATVNGNKVVLTLAGNNVLNGVAANLKVEIGTATVDSITYELTAEDGKALSSTYDEITFGSDDDESLTITDNDNQNVTVTTAVNATANVYFVAADGTVTVLTCAGKTATGNLPAAGYYYVYTGNVVKEVNIR